MSTIRNNKHIWLALLMWFCLLTPAKAESGAVNVQEIVFSHIQDAYTWHITEWNGKEIAIPLPILVRSEENGWDCFLSSRLHHGQTYHNYYIAEEGEYAGKVVERTGSGEEMRPLDLSLTKNVFGLFISSGILLWVILGAARQEAEDFQIRIGPYGAQDGEHHHGAHQRKRPGIDQAPLFGIRQHQPPGRNLYLPFRGNACRKGVFLVIAHRSAYPEAEGAGKAP